VPRDFGFFSGFFGIRLTLSFNLQFDLRLGGIPYEMRFSESLFPYGFFIKTTRVLLKTFKSRTRGRLGTNQEDFKTTQGSTRVPSSLGMVQVLLRTFSLWNLRMLRTTRQGHQDYSKTSCSTTKYSGACGMDIPRPTTQVGTRTDYSVGPWDYSTCAIGHQLTWSVRTTER
jgi:hypothetical protein